MQGGHGSLGGRALHHTRQHATGATFIELGNTRRSSGLTIILPEDRGDDLLDQRGTKIGWLGEGATRGVGIDRDLRALELDALQEGFESQAGGLHETAMVGTSDHEGFYELEGAELLGAGDGLGNLLGVARNHHLPRAIKVRGIDIECSAEFSDVIAGPADDGGHAALGLITGELHQATTFGDDLEARLKIPDTRDSVSGQLPKREPQAGLEVVEFTALLEDLSDGVALDVEGGLADPRLREDFGRPFEADLSKVKGENLGRPIVETLGEGRPFVKGLTHAHDLGALTREQECGGHC